MLGAVILFTGTVVSGNGAVLDLRASVIGGAPGDGLRIELLRWSTDAERAPMLAPLAAPAASAPAPPAAAPAGAPVAPAGGRAGRGGRGGRGAAPPLNPLARLAAAVKAAPTIGFIWGGGSTGYSIKYAWQSASSEAVRRVVLVTDRRIGAAQPVWPASSVTDGDSEFTVIEMRVDARGNGEAKTSIVTGVIVDADARTLALDRFAAAPAQLRITP